MGYAVSKSIDEEEKTILNVKPGITDWASLQVRDEGARLRGSSDPDGDYLRYIWPEKRRLQLTYVADHSFWIDIKIILLTAKALTIDLVSKR